MSRPEPIVRFVGIGKTYDGIARIVDKLDLDIMRGEFLTLLGPSGSGKTTTLMLILMDQTDRALYKHLTEQMQLEIRRLHQRLRVTMAYDTHDQPEALTISELIAVFHRGRIDQLDTPERMYEYPTNAFIARFIG